MSYDYNYCNQAPQVSAVYQPYYNVPTQSIVPVPLQTHGSFFGEIHVAKPQSAMSVYRLPEQFESSPSIASAIRTGRNVGCNLSGVC